MRRVLAILLLALLVTGCTASGKDDPVQKLFAQHGWAVTGEMVASRWQLPADFHLRSGSFPWRVYLDLSSAVGLDFQAHAGQEVPYVRFPVRDTSGGRLQDIAAKYALQGVALLGEDGAVIGAWLTYTERDGTMLVGIPGYALDARDLEAVTGLTWPEYADKHGARN